MSQLTLTAASNALKKRFSPQNLALIGYQRHKMLGLIPKDTNWTGEAMLHTVYHSGGAGRGTTVAYAEANERAVAMARFTLERARNHATGKIDREFLLASRDQGMALLNGKMALFKAKQYEMMRDLSQQLWSDGSGARGRIALNGIAPDSPAAGQTTITLASPASAVNFEKGMRIVAGATALGDLRGAGADGDPYEIIAINRIAGTFVVLGLPQAGSGWAEATDPSDFLFVFGDAQDNSGIQRKMDGYFSWCPDTDPVLGGTLFRGVDRGVDVSRLSGIRYSAAASGVDDLEAIMDMGTLMQQEGAQPKVCVVNGRVASRIAKQLQGQVTYNDVASTDARVFYHGFVVQTGAGDVTVLSDQDCPANKGAMFDPAALRLVSLGDVPHLVDEDGLALLRVPGQDQFAVRFASYANLVVDRPHELGNITFASVP